MDKMMDKMMDKVHLCEENLQKYIYGRINLQTITICQWGFFQIDKHW